LHSVSSLLQRSVYLAKHFSLLIFKAISFLYLFEQMVESFAESFKFPDYVVFQI